MLRSIDGLRANRLALAISSVLAAASSIAADAPDADRQSEVVVTARKAPERLLDVPISISAFVSEDLTETAARDLFDLSSLAPGFTFERLNRYGVQGGVSRPVIRGMANVLGEGNAAVFVDGIPYSDSILSFPFELVDRVEVIKGPQAAMFGRATFAGAINLVTKKGTNTPDHHVSVRAAEFGDYETNILSRGALSEDRLFYVVHARYYTFDGMYKNTLDNEKIGGEESYNVNTSLEYRPGDVFSATVSAGLTRDDDGMPAMTLQDRFKNNCYLNSLRQYYCGEVQEQSAATLDIATLDDREGIERETTRVSTQLEWDFGGVSIISNSGAFFTDQEYGYDSTYQGATAFGATTVPDATGFVRTAGDPVRTGGVERVEVSERDEWSTELRVQSNDSGRVNWLAGVYYYQSRRTFEEQHFAVTAPTVFSGETRVDNIAGFAALGIDITKSFDIRAEVRYAEDTIGNFKATPTPVLIEETFDSVSPRFSMRYKLAPNSMIYASAALGNKPGVINADPRFPAEIQFAQEEEAWSYEVGTKNRFANRFELNIAAYFIDWTNQQLTSVVTLPGPTTLSYVSNAARSEVKGAEFEFKAMLTENLSAGVLYAYTNAEFVELTDAEALNLFGNASVAGKQLPGVPEQQASIFGKLAFDVGAQLQGYVRTDASYTDRKYDQIYNLAHTGYRELVNLTLGIDGTHWGAQLFVRNLTDDRTPHSVTRYVDQLNLNVPQHVNADPAQNNVPGSNTTERAFFFGLPAKRQIGASFMYRF
jgi:outer membrane receptor protein involved in Fe transport